MAANDNPSLGPDLNPEHDPEIAALLEFEPAPRKRDVVGAWTPELQREFIARLAVTGSPGRAAEEMGKTETGVRKLYRSPHAASFRAAWDRAVELAKSRLECAAAEERVAAGSRPPSLDARRKYRGRPAEPLPGQVMNEMGEWEHPDSIARRADEAKDSISMKLRNCRRLFLADISGSPGKRAAFEILTEYEVDWEKAARLEMQTDEPWKRFNMREADMILTCENGWHAGMAWGEDKMRELRDALDEHRAAEGLPPIDWGDGESTERSDAD